MKSFYKLQVTSYKLQILLPVLITLLALVLRLPGLGTVMTADESNWMIRSRSFWQELAAGNPGGTFLTTHPGALTMWLAGGGITWQEHRLGFSVTNANLLHFRKFALFPITVTTAVLIGVATFLLWRLLGAPSAVAGGILLAADPYLVGMSQIVHVDALLALLMLVALLAYIVYCQTKTADTAQPGRSLPYVLLAGVAAGAAMSNKLLPALWLFPVIGAVSLVYLVQTSGAKYRAIVRTLLLTPLLAFLTFFILWPALWVKDDVNFSLKRDYASVITQEHSALEESDDPANPATFYLLTLLGRTPPHVGILALGTIAVVAIATWRRRTLPIPLWLALYAAGYIILVTFVAKKGDRYALPALVVLPMLAGWGIATAAATLWARLRKSRSRKILAVGLSIVALAIVSLPLLWSPHAIAYNNPLFTSRPLSQQGWGEGLEQAAAYLNTDPLGSDLYVASWYPTVLGTYFHGHALSLSSRRDHRVGYVVLYRNMAGRGPDELATNVLEEYKDATPIHTVTIAGEPYVWIYDSGTIHKFKRHVGELTAGMEVGQTVKPDHNNWQRIDIGLSTFSSRANTVDVILHIRRDPNSTEDLRTLVVNAADIKDSEWNTFTFAPIPDSAGKEFYVALESPRGRTGDAITVRMTESDVVPGQLLIRRRPLVPGERNDSFLRSGDLAYRFE